MPIKIKKAVFFFPLVLILGDPLYAKRMKSDLYEKHALEHYKKAMYYYKEEPNEHTLLKAENEFRMVLDKYLYSKISSKAYYGLERYIISGYSGSGGYFIPQEKIAMLYRYRRKLEKYNIPIKCKYNAHDAFARTYLFSGKYYNALHEFRKELAEYNKETDKDCKKMVALLVFMKD